MKKSGLLAAIFIGCFFHYSAPLVRAQQNACQETALKSNYQIPQAFKSNNADSLAFLMHRWERDCGMNEMLFRLKTLLQISQGIETDFFANPQALNYLRIFRYREFLKNDKKASEIFLQYEEYLGYVKPGSEFDIFTKNLAGELLKTSGLRNELARDILMFYAGDSEHLIEKLKQDAYTTTNLQADYNEVVKKLQALPEFRLGVFTGIWSPLGNAAALGNHPLLGAELGIRKRKNQLALAGEFRFADTPSPISVQAENKDTIITSKFSGHYVGLEYSRAFNLSLNSALYATAGAGLDGFDAVKKTQGFQSKTINSLNINLGLGYSYRLNAKTSLALQARYHFIDYDNPFGTPLDGHALSVRLVLGFNENARKFEGLRQLGY